MGVTVAKGSPEAQAWAQRLSARKREIHAERVRQAQAALGPDASKTRVARYVREAKRAQSQANAAASEHKRQSKIAADQLMAAAQEAEPEAPRRAPQAAPLPTMASNADDLYLHPIFGRALTPNAVTSVAIIRLRSEQPEHKVPGLSYGYLHSVPYEEFSEDAVAALHGGGVFQFEARQGQRVVARSDAFTIAGRAKPFFRDGEYPQPAAPAPGNGNGNGSRLGGAFQVEPAGDAPAWFRSWADYAEKRLERQDAVLDSLLAKPAESTTEDKLERYKRELEAKDEADQRRHERRLAELKAEIEREGVREAARAEAQAAAARAGQDAQSKLLEAIVTSQSGMNATILQALVAKGGGDHGVEKLIAPMVSGWADLMKVQNGQMNTMLGVVRDALGGEDNRTIGTRVLDMVESSAGKVWDKAGDQLLLRLVEMLGKPAAGDKPVRIPPGYAFTLPDGRVVSPEDCAEFVARYRAAHGVDPSNEVCVRAFTQYLNWRGQQQGGGGGGGGQPLYQAAQAQQQAQLLAVANITQAQAQELIQDARIKAAAKATQEGKPPEESARAADAEAQRFAQHLQQQVFLARQALSGAAPQPPPAQQAAVGAQAPPAAAMAPAAQQAVAPPPPPAPAALAAAAQAQAAPPATQPATPPATATMIQQLAQQAVSPAPAPGPVPPPQSVVIPWMSRFFLQDAVEAFQGTWRTPQGDPRDRITGIEFLRRALASGKISLDAKLMIGRIYEDSADDEALSSVLSKVAALLSSRGVQVPPEFVGVFQSAPDGAPWLDQFLFACSCSTIEEAEKQRTEEKK